MIVSAVNDVHFLTTRNRVFLPYPLFLEHLCRITVFSKNNCMQCKMTKKFLEQNGADFEEINIDEQPDKIDYVKGLGFTAAPVIEAGETVFSGFQPNKLKAII